MWVESEVGKGSRFHFTMRLPPGRRVRLKILPDIHCRRCRGVKALVVDDSATNRRIMQGILSRWGINERHGSWRTAETKRSRKCLAAC